MWCAEISDEAAVRSVMILTASRCESRMDFWKRGAADFQGLAGLTQEYVSEKRHLIAAIKSSRETGIQEGGGGCAIRVETSAC